MWVNENNSYLKFEIFPISIAKELKHPKTLPETGLYHRGTKNRVGKSSAIFHFFFKILDISKSPWLSTLCACAEAKLNVQRN